MAKCEYGRCKRESEIYYEGHHVCDKHYNEFCDQKIDLDKYFKVEKKKISTTIGLKQWVK